MARAGAERKKKKTMSPILDQIVFGGACFSLDLITLRENGVVRPLFRCSALNNTIIFKYPNFTEELNEDWEANLHSRTLQSTPGRKKEGEGQPRRPIETAIYIPDNPREIRGGGYAIYLRQRNYHDLLKEYLGLDTALNSPDLERDLEILKVLDGVPSLDPFLLKNSFHQAGIEVDEGYLKMSEYENAQIKRLISARIEPIVRKALGGDSDADSARAAARLKRFLDAIWDPTMDESQLFVQAFGIRPDEAVEVFGAWKGVTFYQFKFQSRATEVMNLMKWLRSPDSIPYDIKMNKQFEQQVMMFRAAILRKLDRTVKVIRSVLTYYDEVFRDLVDNNDPSRFREFLASVQQRYWVMGYCSSSLDNVISLQERALESATDGKLSTERLTEFLSRCDVALNTHPDVNA